MEELPNKRGLFLTNIVSKAYENITDRSSDVKFDKSQNGGTKGKGGVDNWMMMMAVVDEGKRLKKRYIYSLQTLSNVLIGFGSKTASMTYIVVE